MAIYRLHRKQWDRGFNTVSYRVKTQQSCGAVIASSTGKRKHELLDGDEQDETPSSKAVKVTKGGALQRKGTSSGLTTIVKKSGHPSAAVRVKKREGSTNSKGWWKELGGGNMSKGSMKGSKGTVRVVS